MKRLSEHFSARRHVLLALNLCYSNTQMPGSVQGDRIRPQGMGNTGACLRRSLQQGLGTSTHASVYWGGKKPMEGGGMQMEVGCWILKLAILAGFCMLSLCWGQERRLGKPMSVCLPFSWLWGGDVQLFC